MITILGWVGSILFSLCGLPQAIKSYKDGNSDGLDNAFLVMWTSGEILTLGVCIDQGLPAFLLFNYSLNLVFLAVIWKYKVWRRV